MRLPTGSIIDALRGSRTAGAAWVGLARSVSLCMSLCIAVFLSRIMEPESYGTYLQILYIYSTLLVLFSLGLPGCYSYFLGRVSAEEGRAIVTKLTGVCTAAGALFSLSLFLFADDIALFMSNASLASGLRVFAVVPVTLMPVAGVEGIMITYRRSRLLACYVCTSRLLTLLCVVTAAWHYKGDVTYVTAAFAAASVLSAAAGIRLSYLPFKGILSVPCHITYRDFFRFALPVFYSGIYGFIITSSSRFFVSRYFGAEDFAVFSNGFREVPLAVIVASSVGSVLLPELSRLSVGERASCIDVWRRSVSKSASIIWPVSVFCIVFAPEIMVTFFGESYRAGADLFRLASLVCFVRVVPFYPLMAALGRMRDFARAHLYTALLLVTTDYITSVYYPSLTALAAVSVATTLFCMLLLFRSVATATGTGLVTLIPLSRLWRLIVVSGAACMAAKAAVAWSEITNMPVALLVAAAVAIPVYLIIAEASGIDYLPILRKSVSDVNR